jgi:hypothetical protein
MSYIKFTLDGEDRYTFFPTDPPDIPAEILRLFPGASNISWQAAQFSEQQAIIDEGEAEEQALEGMVGGEELEITIATEFLRLKNDFYNSTLPKMTWEDRGTIAYSQ